MSFFRSVELDSSVVRFEPPTSGIRTVGETKRNRSRFIPNERLLSLWARLVFGSFGDIS
jgi:hypothetical protein